MKDKIVPVPFIGSVKKYRKLLLSVLWVIFCLSFFIYLIKTGRIGYETNDDEFLAMISSGVFGRIYAHTAYNNIIWGAIVAVLSSLFPLHNWTILMYIACILAAYIMLGIICIVITKKNMTGSVVLPLLFVMATFRTLIIKMNYSKSGAVLLGTGIIVLIATLDTEDYKNTEFKIIRVLSYIMISVGSLVRTGTLMAVVPFFAILVLYILVKYRKDIKGRLLIFIGVSASVLSLWLVGFIVYHADKGWSDYWKYRDVIVELYDYYGIPDYESHAGEYEELGINENDVALLVSWQHGDMDYFDTEKLSRLSDISKAERHVNVDGEYIEDVIQSIFNLAGEYTIVYVLLMLAVFVTFVGDPRIFATALGAVGVCFGEIGYLIYKGRFPERSFMLEIIVALCTVIYLCVKGYADTELKFTGTVSLVLIMLFGYFTLGFSDIKEIEPFTIKNRDNVTLLESELMSHPDNLYVWDVLSFSDAVEGYASPFEHYSKNWMGNSIVTGGWLVGSPILDDVAKPFGGADNPYRLLAENPNTYMVIEKDNPIVDKSSVEQYIKDHYDPNATCKTVEVIGGFEILQFK